MIVAGIVLALANLGVADQSLDPARVRAELSMSMICADKVGGGGGILDFVPSENQPTLHFRLGSPPLMEKAYIKSASSREGHFEVVISGVAYGQDARLVLRIPIERSKQEFSGLLRLDANADREIPCIIMPPAAPGASK